MRGVRFRHTNSITLGELLMLFAVDLALGRHGRGEMRAVDHLVAVRGLNSELVVSWVRGNDDGGAVLRNTLKVGTSLSVLNDVAGGVLCGQLRVRQFLFDVDG